MNNSFTNYNKIHIYKCQYCNKECNSLNSLKQHEIRCKLNPNHIIVKSNWNSPNRVKNNQYTKAKQLGLSLPEVPQNVKQNFYGYWENKHLSSQTKEKLKNIVNKKINQDNWHLSFSKARTIEYKGYKFQGSWEVAFAKYLDNLNIKWERPNKKFDYIYNNDNHKYLPDFYLPKYNLYIEIKGYPTLRDFCKWEQFIDNLDIYFGDDLYNLGIIESYKDIYNNIDNKFRIKHLNIGDIAFNG